jgi:dihydroflavonol-4-reductase
MTLTLITGAGGFVGGHLIQALLAEGRPLRALALNEAEAAHLCQYPLEVMRGDITQAETLAPALAGAGVVYHLAAMIALQPYQGPAAHKINVEGVANLLRAAEAAGVRRVVHFSSFHAQIQTPFTAPLTEDSPLVPPDYPVIYNRTKALGERLVQAAKLETVIIRPTAMLGPEDRGPSYLGQSLIDFVTGKLPFVPTPSNCDFVDVRDVVAGAVAAEKRAPSGEAYLLGGRNLEMSALIALAAKTLGRRARTRPIPLGPVKVAAYVGDGLARLTGRPMRPTLAMLEELIANPDIRHDKAARDLGYQPRPIEQTLREAFEWYREGGLLP